MNDALIGWSGFVGTTLLRQRDFACRYRSTNMGDIDGGAFDMVVCAGAPAKKWLANREPEADLRAIEGLIAHLKTIRCTTFVLISTVDVFSEPAGVDEGSPVDEAGLHAYGLHRRLLEKFVDTHFEHSLIVRLPGLVGPGLRKNVVFDLLNENKLAAVDSRSRFQFYPMVNLWPDVQTALDAGLRLLHLSAEPVSVAELAQRGFARTFANTLAGAPVVYDMRSRHAALFGGSGAYQYSARDSIQAVRCYAQSEARTQEAA